MKISRDAIAYGKTIKFNSVEDAVNDALTPSPYSYEHPLEKLQAENEKLREVLSRLVECIYGESNGKLNKAQSIEYILGYGYKVEE